MFSQYDYPNTRPKFKFDEYEVTVLESRDQYNDYSVAYDIFIQVKDLDKTWTQTIVAAGEDMTSIKNAFRKYVENGWVRQPVSK